MRGIYSTLSLVGRKSQWKYTHLVAFLAVSNRRTHDLRFKGRRKRETMGAGKEANVRYWSRTVAIEVYFQFEHAVFE